VFFGELGITGAPLNIKITIIADMTLKSQVCPINNRILKTSAMTLRFSLRHPAGVNPFKINELYAKRIMMPCCPNRYN